VTTGTIEIETIPILFGHRVQLSIPLSVLLFLAQFLELFVKHYRDHDGIRERSGFKGRFRNSQVQIFISNRIQKTGHLLPELLSLLG
jgi:hypothetical protein